MFLFYLPSELMSPEFKANENEKYFLKVSFTPFHVKPCCKLMFTQLLAGSKTSQVVKRGRMNTMTIKTVRNVQTKTPKSSPGFLQAFFRIDCRFLCSKNTEITWILNRSMNFFFDNGVTNFFCAVFTFFATKSKNKRRSKNTNFCIYFVHRYRNTILNFSRDVCTSVSTHIPSRLSSIQSQRIEK